MLGIYNICLPLVALLLRILARLRPQTDFLRVRVGVLDRWRRAPMGEKPLWFHVSSVGELEQVRPVIEYLKEHGENVILSYFSSAVPRLVKDWSFVTHADYLPLDFPTDMDELMRVVNPKALILNRYDLWPNHLAAAKKLSVPVILVNASTPPLGLWGTISLWARTELFRAIYAWTFVDSAAAAAWEPYVQDRVRGLVTGNPRVDRALARVDQALQNKKGQDRLASWKRQDFCLVAGSTWEKDEELLLAAWTKISFSKSLVIVPHEPTVEHLEKLEKKIDALGLSRIRFSELTASRAEQSVLVVDQRGFLAEIYGAGNIAYVGGGFGRQIHSIIEPLAHGLPTAFGPHYTRSPEAITLLAAGAAYSTGEPELLANWFSEMHRDGEGKWRACEALRVFLQIHRGAGHRVAEFLLGCLPR